MRRNVGRQTREQSQDLRKKLSPPERRLWKCLRRKQFRGLYVRRQHPIGPYIADFFIPDLKLVIELDGSSHDSRLERDRARDCYLKEQGYEVLRFQNRDILYRINDILEYLWNYCEERMEDPLPRRPGEGKGGG